MLSILPSCCLFGALFAPAESTPQAAISVLLYNYARVTSPVLFKAESEAGRIYKNAGIALAWVDCPLSAEDEGAYPACRTAAGPARLAVRVLSSSAGYEHLLDRDSFGVALLPEDRVFGFVANVFARPAEALSKGHAQLYGTILGGVLAHEIGHLLLGAGSHSPTGIMRAEWRAKELNLIAEGRMYFSSQQALRLRANVDARNAEKMARGAAEIHAVHSRYPSPFSLFSTSSGVLGSSTFASSRSTTCSTNSSSEL